MQDVVHDCLIRDFCVVSVSVIHWVGFPLAHVSGKRLSSIVISSWVIRLPVVLDEIFNEWIRAGCVVGWIGQGQDVFVLANGEPFNLAKLRVFEFLAQFFQEILAAFLIAFKGYAETFYRIIVRDHLLVKEIARFRIARDQLGFEQPLLFGIIPKLCHSDPRFGRCHQTCGVLLTERPLL